jgi:hypothetical protein
MHECGDKKTIGCVLNEHSGKLFVYTKYNFFPVNYCPFCGYSPDEQINSCKLCGHFLEPDGSCVMCLHIDGTCGCCPPSPDSTKLGDIGRNLVVSKKM